MLFWSYYGNQHNTPSMVNFRNWSSANREVIATSNASERLLRCVEIDFDCGEI